jgi:ABC-type branched-subunit amino acid transport system substrate-binding protein
MRGRVALAGLLALALVATACGREDSGTDGTSESSPSTSAADPQSGDFGTLSDVCRDGSPAGSPAPGVTPTSITVGTFSDPSAQFRPGLNQELFDVATVFSEWCNARGGINGRRIVVNRHDAALFNVKARMTEACRDDFMLVGGGAVFDQDGVETRLQCLLPDIAAYTVSTKARGADLLAPAIPNPLEVVNVGALRYLQRTFPHAAKRMGLLTGDVNTTKAVADQIRDIAKDDLGMQFVYDDVYPAVGISTWTPYAQKLKDTNTRGLIWIGEPESLAELLDALRDVGHQLDFVRTDANHYDRKLIEAAGTSLEGAPVYVHTGYAPFEGAKPSSPTGQYLAAFDQYLPDGKRHTGLAIAAWSAWLLFAKSAGQCGDDLTRRCVYDTARATEAWTGGGLHAPAGKPCFTVEQATPDGFVLVKDTGANEGIYTCRASDAVSVDVDPGDYTTLADVGRSMEELR